MTEQEYAVFKENLLTEVAKTIDRISRPLLGLEQPDNDETRIMRFIDECCIISIDSGVSTTELFRKYEQWRQTKGIPKMTHLTFSQTLRPLKYKGITYGLKNGLGYWSGVAPRAE